MSGSEREQGLTEMVPISAARCEAKTRRASDEMISISLSLLGGKITHYSINH